VEHRCGNRVGIQTAVEIEARGLAPVVGQARDLSLAGMFVELERGSLPLNLAVHLRFEVAASGPSSSCQIDGVVVRQAPCGCGLLFSDLDSATLDILRSVVRPAGPPSGSP